MKNKKESRFGNPNLLSVNELSKRDSAAVIRQIVPYSMELRRVRKSEYTSPLFVSFKIS